MPAQPRAGNSSGTLEHWPAAAPTGEGSCAITPRPSRLRLDQSSLPFEVPAIPAAAASHSRNASFACSHSGSSSSHVATAHEASSSSLEAPSQQQHFYQQPRHYHCSVESYVEHVEDLAALAVPAVPALPALSMSSVAQAAAYPADAFTATTALQPAAAWPLHEGGIDEGAMGGQAGHSQRIASPDTTSIATSSVGSLGSPNEFYSPHARPSTGGSHVPELGRSLSDMSDMAAAVASERIDSSQGSLRDVADGSVAASAVAETPTSYPTPLSLNGQISPVQPISPASSRHGTYQGSDFGSSRYSRASIWTEMSSQHSSTISTPDGGYDSRHTSRSSPSKPGNTPDFAAIAPSDTTHMTADDLAAVGLGITSDRTSVGRARLNSVAAQSGAETQQPSHPPVSLDRSFSHHRNPSWIRRGLQAQANASVPDLPDKPVVERNSSNDESVALPSPPQQSNTRPVVLPLSIPRRVDSRSRSLSEASRKTASSRDLGAAFSGAAAPALPDLGHMRELLRHRPSLASVKTPAHPSGNMEYLNGSSSSPIDPQSPTIPARSRNGSLQHFATTNKSVKAKGSESSLRSAVRGLTTLRRENSERDSMRRRNDYDGVEAPPKSSGSLSEHQLAGGPGYFSSPFRRWRGESDASETAQYAPHSVASRPATLTLDDVDALSEFSSDGGFAFGESDFALATTDDTHSQESDDTPSRAVAAAASGPCGVVEAGDRPFSMFESQVGPSTTHLVLKGCRDSRLPEWLERTLPVVGASLLALDLSDTGLTAIPRSLTACYALEELNVSLNPLQPSDALAIVGDLKALRVLVADDIGITSLSQGLGHLKQLRSLSVCRNKLSHLPTWLHKLPLERLLIEGNPLQGNWASLAAGLLSRCTTSAALSRSTSSSQYYSRPEFRSHIELPPLPVDEPRSAPAGTAYSQRKLSESNMVSGSGTPLSALGHHGVDAEAVGERLRRSSNAASLQGHGGSRRPDMDRKWSGILRKMNRKASVATLSSHGSALDSSVPMPPVPGSGTASPALLSAPAVTESASLKTPMVADYDRAKLDRSAARKSYLPLPPLPTQGVAETAEDRAEHARHIRDVFEYLRDLDDLTEATSASPTAAKGDEATRTLRQAKSTTQLGAAHPGTVSMNRNDSVTSTTSSGGMSGAAGSESSEASHVEEAQHGSSGIQYKDNSTRRMRIIREILDTEETYARQLEELVNIYLLPMRAVDREGTPYVPDAEHRIVFNNVESILHLHAKAFLPSLRAAAAPLLRPSSTELSDQEEAARTAATAQAVAQAFLRHCQFFKMYQQYVNGLDAAQRRVSSWIEPAQTSSTKSIAMTAYQLAAGQVVEATPSAMSSKERKRLRGFMQRARGDPRHSQLSIESYLLLPVQRIPRYRLLIEDLVRSTPPERVEDPASMVAALDAITVLASGVNESKRQSEQDRKLLQWQARIRGRWPSPLVQPHRRLLRDGPLILRRVVHRTRAFDAPASNWATLADVESDGAVALASSNAVRVDALHTARPDKFLHVLVCNDLIVALSDASKGRDEHAPVEMYAVLHSRPETPATVDRLNNLRIIDSKNILYFACSSRLAAEAWRDAINLASRSRGD